MSLLCWSGRTGFLQNIRGLQRLLKPSKSALQTPLRPCGGLATAFSRLGSLQPREGEQQRQSHTGKATQDSLGNTGLHPLLLQQWHQIRNIIS